MVFPSLLLAIAMATEKYYYKKLIKGLNFHGLVHIWVAKIIFHGYIFSWHSFITSDFSIIFYPLCFYYETFNQLKQLKGTNEYSCLKFKTILYTLLCGP